MTVVPAERVRHIAGRLTCPSCGWRFVTTAQKWAARLDCWSCGARLSVPRRWIVARDCLQALAIFLVVGSWALIAWDRSFGVAIGLWVSVFVLAYLWRRRAPLVVEQPGFRVLPQP